MITNTNDLMIDVAYIFKQQSVMFGDEIELEILLANNGPSNVTISAISGILIIFTFYNESLSIFKVIKLYLIVFQNPKLFLFTF